MTQLTYASRQIKGNHGNHNDNRSCGHKVAMTANVTSVVNMFIMFPINNYIGSNYIVLMK